MCACNYYITNDFTKKTQNSTGFFLSLLSVLSETNHMIKQYRIIQLIPLILIVLSIILMEIRDQSWWTQTLVYSMECGKRFNAVDSSSHSHQLSCQLGLLLLPWCLSHGPISGPTGVLKPHYPPDSGERYEQGLGEKSNVLLSTLIIQPLPGIFSQLSGAPMSPSFFKSSEMIISSLL